MTITLYIEDFLFHVQLFVCLSIRAQSIILFPEKKNAGHYL